MSNGLSLNSLDRFTKQSSRLVLETHSTCEAPAGRIGVVLRWGNPRRGLPAVIRVAPLGEIALHINGKPCTSGRTVLPFGDGVVALHFTQITGPEPMPLALAERDTGTGEAASRVISVLACRRRPNGKRRPAADASANPILGAGIGRIRPAATSIAANWISFCP
jgi:hypothetical protein